MVTNTNWFIKPNLLGLNLIQLSNQVLLQPTPSTSPASVPYPTPLSCLLPSRPPLCLLRCLLSCILQPCSDSPSNQNKEEERERDCDREEKLKDEGEEQICHEVGERHDGTERRHHCSVSATAGHWERDRERWRERRERRWSLWWPWLTKIGDTREREDEFCELDPWKIVNLET